MSVTTGWMWIYSIDKGVGRGTEGTKEPRRSNEARREDGGESKEDGWRGMGRTVERNGVCNCGLHSHHTSRVWKEEKSVPSLSLLDSLFLFSFLALWVAGTSGSKPCIACLENFDG